MFLSCSKSNINKAESLIEIGDYTQAVSLLNTEVEKNPKNINARELLVKCYDFNKEWNKAIEQLKILNKINPQVIYDMGLLKFYALNHQFSDARKLLDQYKNYNKNARDRFESIDNKYIIKQHEMKIIVTDSLCISSDSLYHIYYSKYSDPDVVEAKRKLDAYADQCDYDAKIEKRQVDDSLHIKNLYLAAFLYELIEDDYFDDYLAEDMLELDSNYVEYIINPVLNYIDKMEEPKFDFPSYYDYHNERRELYEVIGYYENALDECETFLSMSDYLTIPDWYKDDEVMLDIVFSRVKYNYDNYFKLLLKLKRYKEVIEIIDKLKSENCKYYYPGWDNCYKKEALEHL